MSTRSLLQALVLSSITLAASSTALWAQTAPAPSAPAPTTQGPAIPGGGRGGFPPVQIGPSAPVPPEVAIPRPSPGELAQINAAVSAFVSSDRSAAGPVLRKFASLLVVPPPRLNVAATYTQTVQRMGPRHEEFVEVARKGGIDLLLHGDSITDWWVQTDEHRAVFNKYFGHIKTANFAIAGDTTQGVLWGLRNGEGQGFQPKAVMLMIGTNNYLDIGSNFLDEKGFFLPNVFRPDNLHPAALGYDIWGQAVQAKLEELMK